MLDRAWMRLLGVLLTMLPALATANSLRFFGNGVDDIDRAKIQIDDPATTSPGPPADVGSTDFTIEFWIKGALADNRGTIRCGSTYGWIEGNTVFDRDRYNQPRSFGIALGNSGRVAFGTNVGNWSTTLCGVRNVLDGAWHHIAVVRERNSGTMRLFVDGQADGSVTGAPGDISYPDNGVPGNYCNGSCAFSDPYIVLGAEKHDAGVERYPSFRGFLDELRLSTVARYVSNFTVPTVPFNVDAATAALYHFDESTGTAVRDAVGSSPGFLRVGGNPVGPLWSSDSPFADSGAGTLALQAATYSAGEAAGTILVTVERSGGSTGSASVSYQAIAATATPGADYEPASGTLNWANGDSQPKSFTVRVIDDAIDEPNETVTIQLTGASGATLGSPTSATLTILDDEATVATPGSLRFSSATYAAAESAGSVVLTVNRVAGSNGAISVNYAAGNGSATAGSDFTAASGTLSWGAGDASARSIAVPILNDALTESAESFVVSLSAPTGGAALTSPSTATVSITDDDLLPPPAGSVQFSAASYQIAESGGAMAVTVRRINGSGGVISVSYATANGSATAGADYTASSGVLTWANGDAADKTFSVPVSTDALVEGNETVNLTLSSPAGGASLGTPAASVLTITNSTPAAGPLLDSFERPNGAALGNGWVERDPDAFSLSGGRALKNSSSGVGGDALVYRPAVESSTDTEVAAELRLTSTSFVGYPQVFARLQTAGLGTTAPAARYLLYIDASTASAVLARQVASGLTTLASLSLSSRLNTTEVFRLRLRTTGTSPVAIGAFVERNVSGSWQIIGQASVNDSSGSRITAAGSTGFGGWTESGYTFDNFTRSNLGAGGASAGFAPTVMDISPSFAAAGESGLIVLVSGSGFTPDSRVRWNGSERATTFVSATELEVLIDASDLSARGLASIDVCNPGIGGGISSVRTFTVGVSTAPQNPPQQ